MMQDEINAATRGIQVGIERTTKALKLRLRRRTARVLGDRVGKAWRGDFYPNKGMNAAGLVYSNASPIIEAHSQGGVLRAKHGRFLAVPTEHVPRGRRGRRVIPSNWPTHRLGPLRFVPRPGRGGLLVADGRITNRGKFSAKQLKSGTGAATVVMYFLVPQVRMKKRLTLDRPIKQAETALVDAIIREYR